jgi:ABC-type Fe3+ transport system permease subunit
MRVKALPAGDHSKTREPKKDRTVVFALAALFAGIMLTSLVATAFTLNWWRRTRKTANRSDKQVRMHHVLPLQRAVDPLDQKVRFTRTRDLVNQANICRSDVLVF